jgi:hypothetical protein
MYVEKTVYNVQKYIEYMSIDSLNTGLRSGGYLRQEQGCIAILSNIF